LGLGSRLQRGVEKKEGKENEIPREVAGGDRERRQSSYAVPHLQGGRCGIRADR